MTETTQAEYLKLQAQQMSEDELLQSTIDCAHTFGWLAAHFRPAKTDKGWRTPVQADGKGFPDLVMVKDQDIIFAELKSEIGTMRTEQLLWFKTLDLVGGNVLVVVWRPSLWLSGEIERILKGER